MLRNKIQIKTELKSVKFAIWESSFLGTANTTHRVKYGLGDGISFFPRTSLSGPTYTFHMWIISVTNYSTYCLGYSEHEKFKPQKGWLRN